ncbi:MAG: hypothetical protein HY062_18125 [Bacteroidetes bacterium]|nr:hypothetical protein [Bacteroidota bacterium]
MAVGFTPKHTEDLTFSDFTQEQFLILLIEASKKMGWSVGYISNNGLIAYTDNGMFSRNFEIKIKLEQGKVNIQSASTGSEMMDWGKNKDNVNGFITNLETLKTSLSKEELDAKYLEIKEQLVSEEEDILKLPPATTTEQVKDFFSIFKPTEGFFITPILLDVNIILFIVMIIGGVNIMLPDNESLLNWGANFRPVTLGGEWCD